MAPDRKAHMSLSEIVLRTPYSEDEVRVAEVDGGADGSVLEIDDCEWFVMMHVPPQGTEAGRRLICVRTEGLS